MNVPEAVAATERKRIIADSMVWETLKTAMIGMKRRQ